MNQLLTHLFTQEAAENRAKADYRPAVKEAVWWRRPDFLFPATNTWDCLLCPSQWQSRCAASTLCDTDLHWMGWPLVPKPERWMIERSTDSRAGRQAVAQRPEDHVTACQGTGFIQWLLAAALAAAQLFHSGRSSNRSLPLKQQHSVVAPELFLCMCCFPACLCDAS